MGRGPQHLSISAPCAYVSQFSVIREIFENLCFFTNSSRCQVVCSIQEDSRGAGAQSVTVKLTGYGFDPHPRR